MALPSLATPKFDLTVPSTKKKIKYRPFIVKEQKIILHAIEMRDAEQLNNALDDVLKDCTFGKVDIDALTVYDVEYLIMQIRAHSVGDVVEINYVCNNHIEDKLLNAEQLKYQPEAEEKRGPGKCETRIPVKVNLSQLEASSKTERPDNRIMLTDSIGVVMRDMPYGVYKTLAKTDKSADAGLLAIAACIECVVNGDEVIDRSDLKDEELINWLEEMTGDDFDKMEAFTKSMPTIRMSMEITCPSCGAKEKVELEGLDDFLA